MLLPDVVELTQKLILLDTVNPPGNEAPAARLTGSLLEARGFKTNYISYGENRLHLVAEKGCSENSPAIIFTGHFDTVPLGAGEWNVNPLGGEVVEGKIYGRGSSDMKSGIAAMTLAAIHACERGNPLCGVRLIFTSGEETGCQGAGHLVKSYNKLGKAKGIVVGEPTSNIPATGHKGGLYLKVTTKGKTAHSSMPHLGENAIYKAARAILKAEKFDFKDEKDSLLGFSTLNVGRMQGGINLNSVPDYAEFTIDARTTANINHQELLSRLRQELGGEVNIEVLVDLPAVSSDENSSFVQAVYACSGIKPGTEGFPKSLPYLTDGAFLQPAYGGVPTVILGPGQPEMAHKTNEYCFVENLERAVEIYKNIILTGGGV